MNLKFWSLKRNSQNTQNLQDIPHTQSSDATASQGTLGGQSNILIAKKTQLSIARFKLLDFIDCCKGDYSSLEKEEDWVEILSQYYTVRKDEENKERLELLCRMQYLRLRASIITMLLNSIDMIYSPSIIKTLKEFDDEFQQFEFSEDNVLECLQMIRNIEFNNDIEYTQLKSDLKKINEKEGESVGDISSTFYNWVSSYNEAFKTSHNVDNISVATYANICYRLEQYLNSQNTKDV